MKKILNLLIISILTILIMPNVFAKDEVSIESIKLEDKSEKTTELSSPTINGLKIGFDLSFCDVGDYAKYEVVVNNNTNKEYELNDETKFSSSNYIEYKYEFKEQTNRIKANSKVTLYITVTYKNFVPEDKLTDGKYIENNEMAITLSNEDNPNTFNNYIYLIIILLTVIVISLLIKNKKAKSISIIVIALLLVPTTIFALEKLKLDVSTKITIEKKYKVTFITEEHIKENDKTNYRLFEIIETKGLRDTVRTTMSGSILPEKIFINDEEYKEYFVIKDEDYYGVGDSVNVKNYKIQRIDDLNSCTKEQSPNYSEQPYDKIICQTSNLVSLTTSAGLYSTEYNINYKDNDSSIMNFQNISYNNWTGLLPKKILFNTPSTFTMPEHDVVILLDNMK